MKDIQATGETFSPQKRTSSTSKIKSLHFFFVGHCAKKFKEFRKNQCFGSRSALIWLSWIRILIGNADPDPGARKLPK
jgi:hypothetical protein